MEYIYRHIKTSTMKYAFPLLAAVFSCTVLTTAAQQPGMTIKSYAGNKKADKKQKYTLAQFDGRWQEKSRTSGSETEAIPADDTLYIRFYNGDKTTTKQGRSVVITGSAEIFKDEYITTSANDFKIKKADKNEISLDDNMGVIHVFERKAMFAYEMEGPPPPPPLADEKYTIDLAYLKTDWYAYRRGANPGFVKSETPVIKKLNLTEKTGDNTYKGEVQYARYGKAIVEPCTLTVNDGKIVLEAAGNTWNMELYKCDAKELVMGKKGELVYYFNNNN